MPPPPPQLGKYMVSQAVDAATAKQYDLILMDMEMPVMNGLEASRIIKERCPSTFIVLLTAHVSIDEDISAVDLLLQKPLRINKIEEVLQMVSKYARFTLSAWDGSEGNLGLPPYQSVYAPPSPLFCESTRPCHLSRQFKDVSLEMMLPENHLSENFHPNPDVFLKDYPPPPVFSCEKLSASNHR